MGFPVSWNAVIVVDTLNVLDKLATKVGVRAVTERKRTLSSFDGSNGPIFLSSAEVPLGHFVQHEHVSPIEPGAVVVRKPLIDEPGDCHRDRCRS